ISKIEAAYPDHAQGLHYPSMHQDYNHGRLTEIDKTIGELGAYDHSRAMIRPIIEEIVDVAHAKNVDIHINDLISKIEAAYPDHAQGLHYPSMHQDYNHGRLTEID
ncbi:hypothetical protein BUE67_15135, partial [Corynebacterium diphtheriae]